MNKEFDCPHKSIVNKDPEVSLRITLTLLKTEGDTFCAQRVPERVYEREHDISCVGPDNPICPDPKSAVKIINE